MSLPQPTPEEKQGFPRRFFEFTRRRREEIGVAFLGLVLATTINVSSKTTEDESYTIPIALRALQGISVALPGSGSVCETPTPLKEDLGVGFGIPPNTLNNGDLSVEFGSISLSNPI